jgi:hypothetical protein
LIDAVLEAKRNWLRTTIAEQRNIFEDDVDPIEIDTALRNNNLNGYHFHEIPLISAQDSQTIVVVLDKDEHWQSSVVV